MGNPTLQRTFGAEIQSIKLGYVKEIQSSSINEKYRRNSNF